MKEIQFQHFKKAPHPFQQYGNLPPAALKNRSKPEDYSSLPQGEQAFVYKVGKKQFNDRHQSSIKENWLGQTQNDTLSQQLVRHQHKVKGKSLQTYDIQGAQGGSLKSKAVKYKQKAQQLKKNGKINGFDHYDYQQQEYKFKMQNAVKLNHSNDMEIGKLISWKGHGHLLNPQKKQQKGKNNLSNLKPNPKGLQNYQNSLKEKYQDFQAKNEQYKQFFKDIKNKEDNYDDFFNKLHKNNTNQQSQKTKAENKQKSSRINTFEGYDSQQMPTPKITSRQYEYSLSEKFQTIEMKNQNDEKARQQKRQRQRKQEIIKYYQPPNYPKKSLQSQFRQEHSLGISPKSSRIYQNQSDESQLLDSSRTSQQYSQISKQKGRLQKEISRRLNPTHLSYVIGSGSYNFGSSSIF